MSDAAPPPTTGAGQAEAAAKAVERKRAWFLNTPALVVLALFASGPLLIVLVYSFLTKEFRGGVIWEFTLAAYDQFFFDRGLFGDEPPTIEWTYIGIF